MEARAQVDDEQTIAQGRAEEAQHECVIVEYGPVERACLLLPEHRIFAPKPDQVTIQSDRLCIRGSLAPIELASKKRPRIRWIVDACHRFLRADARELGDERRASLTNRLRQRSR